MKPKTPILLMSAVLLLAALSSSPAFALSDEVQADLLNQQIVAALDAKNWQQAEQLFTDYDAFEVTMPTPLILKRAIVSYHLKKFSKALRYIEDYLDKADRNSPSYKKALTMYAEAAEAAKTRLAEMVAAAARGRMSEFLCNSATRDDLWCVEESSNQPGCYYVEFYYYGQPKYWSWSGPCVNGLAHGNGILSRKDIYEETGSYKTGFRQGKWLRKVNWNGGGGVTTITHYVNGKRHGKQFEKRTNGVTIETPYVDGKKHGKRIYRQTDGYTTEATYVDGKQHGKALEIGQSGTIIETPWVDGKAHGKQVTKWASGGTRVTPYVDGKKHGKAFGKWRDGSESVDCYHKGEEVAC